MSSSRNPQASPDVAAGLCARCEHARQTRNAQGSVFWQCQRARTDARYRRYPRLPVTTCEGHEPALQEEA